MDIETTKRSLEEKLILSEERFQQVNFKFYWPKKLADIKRYVLGDDVGTKSELLARLSEHAIDLASLSGEHLVDAMLTHFSHLEMERTGLYVNPGDHLLIDESCPSRNPQLILGPHNPTITVSFKGALYPALHVFGTTDNTVTLENGVCSGFGSERYVTRIGNTLMCRGMHEVIAEDYSLVRSNSQSVVHKASKGVRLFDERVYGSYAPLKRQDEEAFQEAYLRNGAMGVLEMARSYASEHVWDLDYKQVNVCPMLNGQRLIARNDRFLVLQNASSGILLREGFTTRTLVTRTEEIGMPKEASLCLRQIKNRLHLEEYNAVALRRNMTLTVPCEGRCFLQFDKPTDSFKIVNPRKENGIVATIPYDGGMDTLSNILSVCETAGRSNSTGLSASVYAEAKRLVR